MKRLAPIALTMGEPGGVGGEIAMKAHQALKADGPHFFIIDDPERLQALGAVARIASPAEASGAFARALPVLGIGSRVAARAGVAEAGSASHVLAAIDRAVAFALSGEAAAVVTNPIQKASLIAAGFAFPGHTEYLGALTHAAPMPAGLVRGPVMMLAAPGLRTVPLTVHLPLREVAARVTADLIVETAIVVIAALKRDFGLAAPRLAIAGLNPHAGEMGAFGTEERDAIEPAIRRLTEAGAAVTGPHPADSLFHETARARYDAALCMYHDQALIPIKTLAFHEAVNVTLGLPIVRTSPDHGAALDIAGKGLADAASLIAAIRLAAEIAARRGGA